MLSKSRDEELKEVLLMQEDLQNTAGDLIQQNSFAQELIQRNSSAIEQMQENFTAQEQMQQKSTAEDLIQINPKIQDSDDEEEEKQKISEEVKSQMSEESEDQGKSEKKMKFRAGDKTLTVSFCFKDKEDQADQLQENRFDSQCPMKLKEKKETKEANETNESQDKKKTKDLKEKEETKVNRILLKKLIWSNHEGTKCVILDVYDTQTIKFTLYDVNFRELYASEFNSKIKTDQIITTFTFSDDEQFMCFGYDNGFFYLCKFENTMEHDLFFDQKKGQIAINQMFQQILIQKTDLKEQFINTHETEKIVSTTNVKGQKYILSKYLFQVIESDQNSFKFFKSRKTISNLLENHQIYDDTNEPSLIKSEYEEIFNQFEVKHSVIDGPFLFGINESKQKLFIYNYVQDKDKTLNIIDKLDQESKEYQINDILVYPSFLEGTLEYFVYIFCQDKFHRFSIHKQFSNFESFTYPKEFTYFNPNKIIDNEIIIFKDTYYKIKKEKKSLEFFFTMTDAIHLDAMKQSYLTFHQNGFDQIFNHYKPVKPVEYYLDNIIQSNFNGKIFVKSSLNCFDEFLTQSDFEQYLMKQNLQPDSISEFKNVVFYSKELGIVIHDDTVSMINQGKIVSQNIDKQLNNDEEFKLKIRSFSIEVVEEIKTKKQKKIMSFLKEVEENITIKQVEALRIFFLGKKAVIVKTFIQNDKNVIEIIQDNIELDGSDYEMAISEDGQLILFLNSKGKIIIQKLDKSHKFFKEAIFDKTLPGNYYSPPDPLNKNRMDEIAIIQSQHKNNQNIIYQVILRKKAFVLEANQLKQIEQRQDALGVAGNFDFEFYFEIDNQWVVFVYKDCIKIFVKLLSEQKYFYEIQTIIYNFRKFENIIPCHGNKYKNGIFYSEISNKKSKKLFLKRVQLYDEKERTIFGIPLDLLIKDNFTTLVNLQKNKIQYHQEFPNNYKDYSEDYDSVIELRCHCDINLEFGEAQKEGSFNIESKKFQDYLKDKALMHLTSYNFLHKKFLLNVVQEKPQYQKFYPQIIQRLQLGVADSDEMKMPFLMIRDKKGQTPFKNACDNKDNFLVKNIFELLISADQTGIMYTQYIVPHLLELKNMGIDLKIFFNSNLSYQKIDENNENFPKYHTNSEYKIVGSNEKDLKNVLENDQLFSSLYSNYQESQSKIDYYVVNLKDLIGINDNDQQINDVQQIIEVIDGLSDFDISYLEIEVIQIIINYKWETYAYPYFRYQFMQLIAFIAIFISNLNSTYQQFGLEYLMSIVLSYIFLLQFYYHEKRQFQINGFKEYVSSFWNIFDICIHLIYPLTILLSNISQDRLYLVKSLQCCNIILLFIKFLFFLRIFKPFSFLVQMFVSVFSDMRDFIIFFSFVIIFFSTVIRILIKDISDYEGIGSAAYFVIALRQSLGDYDTASFSQNSDYDILAWLVWLVVMMVGNVIFMNFIIAVVGQSYENCMQQSEAQQFKVKVLMIREYEQVMTDEEKRNQNWFPNFIVVRKPLQEGRDASGDTQNEWKGMLREMQKGVKKQIDALKEEQKKFNQTIENKMNLINKKITDENKQMNDDNQKLNDHLSKQIHDVSEENLKTQKMLKELKDLFTQKVQN